MRSTLLGVNMKASKKSGVVFLEMLRTAIIMVVVVANVGEGIRSGSNNSHFLLSLSVLSCDSVLQFAYGSRI